MEIVYIGLIIVFIILVVLNIIFKVKDKTKFQNIVYGFLCAVIAIEISCFIFEKPCVNDGESVIKIEIGELKTFNAPSVKYHFQDVTSTVEKVSEIDLSKPGEYEIEYKVPTIIGYHKFYQKVFVVDSIAPQITLIGEANQNVSYTKEYEEEGFTVQDNYDKDLKENVKIEKKEISEFEYDLIYSVEDSSNNKTSVIRKIYIVDDVPPQIKLNGSKTEVVALNGEYSEKGATAIDEKDGDLSANIEISGTVDTKKQGTYEVTYKVSDSKGNVATVVRKVKVQTTVSQNENNGNDGSGIIYLTFDDGPSESITPKILDILKKKNVKATFFVLNYGTNTEYLIKREYNEGHTVAIHGYSHDYSQIYTSVDAYMNNIKKLQDKLNKTLGGYNATITRFPGGSSNTVSKKYSKGIMTYLTKHVVEEGYTYFDWNIGSGDAGEAKNSSDVYNNVVKGLQHNRSNVVLMHDFSGNTKTLNALEDIIDYGLKNGYEFRAITSDTPMVKHGVNN